MVGHPTRPGYFADPLPPTHCKIPVQKNQRLYLPKCEFSNINYKLETVVRKRTQKAALHYPQLANLNLIEISKLKQGLSLCNTGLP